MLLSSASQFETAASVAESLATVAAITIGGIWSYLLFVKKRQRFPRAKLQHKVSHRALPRGGILLSVEVTVSNSGEVLLSLISWEIIVRQMLPPRAELLRVINDDQINQGAGTEIIEWHEIAARKERKIKHEVFEIEPGESQQFSHSFLIDPEVKTILLDTYFQNVKKKGREVGWSLSTIHDLKTP